MTVHLILNPSFLILHSSFFILNSQFSIIISLHPCPDVLAQAFLVEPRLGAVEVAHIEEAQDGLVFRAAVAFHDQYMVLGRDADGDGVVQRGRRGIGAPVHGVDAHRTGGCHHGLDVAHVGHGVVADGHARVRGTSA